MTNVTKATPEEIAAELEATKLELNQLKVEQIEFKKQAVITEAGFGKHPAKVLLEAAFEEGMTAEQFVEKAKTYGLTPVVESVTTTPVADNLAGLRRVVAASAPIPGSAVDFADAIKAQTNPKALVQLIREHGRNVAGDPIVVVDPTLG